MPDKKDKTRTTATAASDVDTAAAGAKTISHDGFDFTVPADVDMLREMMPLQNGGTSGRNIAEVCRRLLNEEPVPQRVCLDRNLQYA